MKNRYPEAYNYLRLIWAPKPGDKVLAGGSKKVVEKYVKGHGVLLQGEDLYWLPGQLQFRPAPKDFDAVLDRLGDIFEYRQLIANNRQVVGIKCNGRVMPVKGHSLHILNQILNLRTVDPRLSLHINRIFEASYMAARLKDLKGKDVGLKLITTAEGSHTT